MTAMKEFLAHQARVTGVIFALSCEWILSIGRDKAFQFHCSVTGRKLGSYQTEAWYTALQYPFQKKIIYIIFEYHLFICDKTNFINNIIYSLLQYNKINMISKFKIKIKN